MQYMIYQPTLSKLNQIVDLIDELNLTDTFYSGYMSQQKEIIQKEIIECINDQLVLSYQELDGIITFFINEETKIIDIAGPYVKSKDVNIGIELIKHIINIYPDHQLNFFFNRESKYYLELMTSLQGVYQGDETILTLNRHHFTSHQVEVNISLNNEKYHHLIKEMHDRIFPNVYLTSSELLKPDELKSLYVLLDENNPIGYALIRKTKPKAFLEIFAIDTPYRGKKYHNPLYHK